MSCMYVWYICRPTYKHDMFACIVCTYVYMHVYMHGIACIYNYVCILYACIYDVLGMSEVVNSCAGHSLLAPLDHFALLIDLIFLFPGRVLLYPSIGFRCSGSLTLN